jgi:Terpene cyclase DEP1
MTPRTALLAAALLAFSVFTAVIVADVGYTGIFNGAMDTPGGTQVFFDLVVVCSLAALWLIGDARRRGVRAWPWVIAIGGAGSIALLAYLLLRELTPSRPTERPSPRARS